MLKRDQLFTVKRLTPQLIERAVGVNARDGEETFDAYVQAGSTHLIFGMGTPWNFDVVKRLVAWRDKHSA